jgi:hypothetical protein
MNDSNPYKSPEADAIPEAGNGKGQLGRRRLLMVTAGSAVLMILSTRIPGLEQLPYIVGLVAAVSAIFFVGTSALVSSESAARGKSNRADF